MQWEAWGEIYLKYLDVDKMSLTHTALMCKELLLELSKTQIDRNQNKHEMSINAQEQTQKLSRVLVVQGLVTVETGNFPPFPRSFPPPPAYIDTCLPPFLHYNLNLQC